MKKREIPVINVGISLIILIFMNICLAAFAVLSLENAVSDYSLSKKTAVHTMQYYKAVNKVQEQLAKKNQELREEAVAYEKAGTETDGNKRTQGQNVKNTADNKNSQKKEETKGIKNKRTQKETQQKGSQKSIQKEIKLAESVSNSQQLVVTLRLDDTQTYPEYYIEKWKLCSSEEWQADDSLDVYKSGK